MNLILNAAIKYVTQFKWSVIPVPKGQKYPVIKWKEYQERFPRLDELEKWFKSNDSNLAVITGSLSNISVIDVDSQTAIQFLKKIQVNSSISVKTIRGMHYYFKYNPRLSTITNFMEKVDIRNDGGIALLPPTPGYTWTRHFNDLRLLPDFPESLLPVSAEEVGQVKQNTEGWISEALRNNKQGVRDTTFVKVIGRMHYDGYTPNDIFEILAPHADAVSFSRELLRKKVDYVTTTYKQSKGTDGQTTGFKIYSPRADWEEYETRRVDKSAPIEIKSGFPKLDEMLYGLRRGELYTVGARTGVGKTSFCINVSANLIKQNKRVLFLSTEMSFDTIWDRCRALLDERDFREGAFFTSDVSSPTRLQVEEMIHEIQPDVLIFDHVQHIGSSTTNRYSELSTFIKELKDMARQNNLVVIVASQLNRGADGINRNTGERVKPAIYHLKECGSIEEESTAVILMHKDHTVDEETDEYVLNLCKNRYGLCGEIVVKFNKLTARMEEN